MIYLYTHIYIYLYMYTYFLLNFEVLNLLARDAADPVEVQNSVPMDASPTFALVHSLEIHTSYRLQLMDSRNQLCWYGKSCLNMKALFHQKTICNPRYLLENLMIFVNLALLRDPWWQQTVAGFRISYPHAFASALVWREHGQGKQVSHGVWNHAMLRLPTGKTI